jgi:site-specific recombinase XerD
MEQAIEQFEQYIKSRYPNSTTVRHYVHDLRQFNQLVSKPPRSITREDVDQFVEEQLERGLAATTVNRRLAALHEFFEYLAAENQEEEWPNPVNWKRHKVKPGKPLPRDVTEPEIERLFAQIMHPRDQAMFRLMLDVGLRVKEVAKLRISDLMATSDSSLGRLRVWSKGAKGSKERFVWLAPETLGVVQAWLEQRPEVADEALFVTRRNKGFSVRGIQERLTYYCRSAGVKVSPHQLRHTFGRRMAEAEMPVTSLAALMGHAKVTTTQVYIAGAGVAVQADYQAAIERLEAARLEAPSVWVDGQEQAASAAEMPDVWTLAGVEPNSSPSPQPMTTEMDLSHYWEGLPGWLTSLLQEYIAHRQRRWKPSQVRNHTRARLNTLRRVWRWLLRSELAEGLDEERISSIADLQRAHVQGFVDARLVAGISSGTVNAELTDLWAFLGYLEERGHPVRPSVFRVKRPKRGDPLPRFLSENDYQHLENTVLQATQSGERDDWLDRAWFYLLSEAGLRISEVCDLRLGDIDLAAQRLIVRQGKENRDRTVPISPTSLVALRTYLPLRGQAQTDHLLIYCQQAIHADMLWKRLHRYGQQAQVAVSPHRLRHTLATRLLNQGMPITSLQRLLGHEKLDTTLVYARVHNETVRRDYERAYARLVPAVPLANEFFNAPTEVAEPQPTTPEVNCV